MHIEEFQDYCLNKKGVEATFPFDEQTLVYKVMGKMFALCSLERMPFQINLKCDPERAEELRAENEDIIAGYHMSKKHWNTLIMEGDLDDKLVCELIDHSYDLVVAKLTKKDKEILKNL